MSLAGSWDGPGDAKLLGLLTVEVGVQCLRCCFGGLIVGIVGSTLTSGNSSGL